MISIVILHDRGVTPVCIKSGTNNENNILPLTLPLSRQGRGKFIRRINLSPLPIDGEG